MACCLRRGGEEASVERRRPLHRNRSCSLLFHLPTTRQQGAMVEMDARLLCGSSAIDRPMSMKKPSEPIVLSERGPKILLVGNFLEETSATT